MKKDLGQQPLGNPTGDHRPSVAAHTPGPWEVNTLAGPYRTEVFAGLVLIADANGQGAYVVPRKEQEANARLIAAAPELLETLIALMKFARAFEAFRDGFGQGVETYCNEVIAKATGESARITSDAEPSAAEAVVPDPEYDAKLSAVRDVMVEG